MAKPHSILLGGSTGIGRTLARSLLTDGHQVTVISRTPPVDLIGVHHIALDLLNDGSVRKSIGELRDTCEQFTNLVFLQRHRGPCSADEWTDEFSVSVHATRRFIEELSEARLEPKTGSIVIVGSHAADLVVTDQSSAYHAVKGALVSMVRFYAVSLASEGLRVNGVTPGEILKEEAEQFYEENPHEHDARLRHTPLKGMGRASEVVSVINFLCSDAASFVTGQMIVVDGGLSLVFQGSLT